VYNKALRDKKEPVVTKDGSYTLHSKEFDECYHSTHDGALQESLQKHVIPAFTLQNKDKEKLTILDICFGLGYNTFTTLYYLQKCNTKVHIVSPEFDKALVESLDRFTYPPEFDGLKPMITKVAKEGFYEDEQVIIEVLFGDARELLPKLDIKFDIVYQDAFSPKKNPLLWTREYFEVIHSLSREEVILTTYSSATPVRMGLYENGFKLYQAPSSGVRSGTIASLKPLSLEAIDMELKKERNPNAKSLRDTKVTFKKGTP
jgi:tRNA U34 5-methylaminomethyl-2-thiouridine-forming methyltransferase MnmC